MCICPSAGVFTSQALLPNTSNAHVVRMRLAENSEGAWASPISFLPRQNCSLTYQHLLFSWQSSLRDKQLDSAGSLGLAEILAGKAARQDDVATLQREDLQVRSRSCVDHISSTPQHHGATLAKALAKPYLGFQPVPSCCAPTA